MEGEWKIKNKWKQDNGSITRGSLLENGTLKAMFLNPVNI
jgi:hypothetical protein